MRLLAFASALLVTSASTAADFDFSVWSASGRLSDSKATSVLEQGASILAQVDGNDDTACANTFLLDGSVHAGPETSLPNAVESEQDWNRVIADGRFSVYVFHSIKWCGGPARGGVFAGCARRGGPIGIVEDFFKPVVVAHEIGHAQGNRHNQTSRFLMFPQAHDANRRVNSGECGKYQLGQIFPVTVGDFPFEEEDNAPQPVVVDPIIDLDFLLSSVWHRPPLDEIEKLTPDHVQAIRDILSGEPSDRWPNAMTILGIMGEADDFALLESAIETATAALSSSEQSEVPWLTIRANALIALGMLFNRTEEVAPVAVLRQMMIAPQAGFPEIGLSNTELEEISRAASIGFAHAGPKATLAFPAAVAQAEIVNLQIANVFSSEGPIVASLPNSRDETNDPSTNPSLALALGPEQERAATAIQSVGEFYAMVDSLKSEVDEKGLKAFLEE